MKSIIKQLYTILLVTVACLTVAGCSDDFKSNLRLDGDVWVNSIKLDEYAGTIDYQNKTIVVGVPYDYDVTRMAVSEINLSEGATASIAVGETIDFSLPVSLTVKNGDVQMSYTITVKRDEAKILTFKLNDTYVGKVDQLSKTISVVVPLTVDITQLKGTFTGSDGVTVTPASGSIQDFTNPVTYTATYRSAVTPYVVTVTQGNVIPTAFIGTFAVCCLLKTGFDVNATLTQLLSGGLILGAFFMATDYSSSPATAKGKIVFGIGCGLLLFIFRACKKTPAEWCSYAILLMNVCSPLIERVTGNKSFGEVKK